MNGPEHPQTLEVMVGLATSYREGGKFEEAASLLNDGLPVARKQLPHDDEPTAAILCEVRTGEAECQGLRRSRTAAPRRPGRFAESHAGRLAILFCQSDLGAALLGQKKFAEAEPLLLASFNAMKQREKTIPPGRRYRLPEVVDRLIELCTATNKPDEVKNRRGAGEVYRGCPSVVRQWRQATQYDVFFRDSPTVPWCRLLWHLLLGS